MGSKSRYRPVTDEARLWPILLREHADGLKTPALVSDLVGFEDHLCDIAKRLAGHIPAFDLESYKKRIHDLVTTPAVKTSTTMEETPSLRALSEENYEFPKECLEGDQLCELAHELTRGTFIPPQFSHADLQAYVGQALDGRVQPAGSTYLNFSTRFYVNKFSYHPQTGKGESWMRVKKVFNQFLDPRPLEGAVDPNRGYAPHIMDGSKCGSGPFMINLLKDSPSCVCYLDEGSSLFLGKAPTDAKAIESALLTLFESNEYASGSFKNRLHEAVNVHLSLVANFTLDSFNESYQGRGTGGSGFLSRVMLAFGTKGYTNGQNWPDLYSQTKAYDLATRIAGLIKSPPLLDLHGEAQALIRDFKKSLEKEDQHLVARIPYYFEKDLTLRSLFSGGTTNPDLVRRSIKWAQEQISLRRRFWPVDAASPQGVLEFKILNEFENAIITRSDRTLQDALRIGRRDSKFSAQQYVWARTALLSSGQIERAAVNRSGNPLYRLRQLV